MNDLFAEPDEAATPLTPDEVRDLLPSYIADRQDLNSAEQENIIRAEEWAMDGRRRDLLNEKFIKDLHRHMLGDVWRWAGKFRVSQRNIGIDFWLIVTELHQLLDDVKTWIQHDTYSADEIAVRLHHRLTQIHPFPNGNGRHARLMADLVVMQLQAERFSWGKKSLQEPGEARARYIEALHAADNHDIGRLLVFART